MITIGVPDRTRLSRFLLDLHLRGALCYLPSVLLELRLPGAFGLIQARTPSLIWASSAHADTFKPICAAAYAYSMAASQYPSFAMAWESASGVGRSRSRSRLTETLAVPES